VIREVNPDVAAALVKYGADAAEAETHGGPPGTGESYAAYTRRIVTAAVLHLIEQGLLTVPGDLASRLAEPVPPDRRTARRMDRMGWTAPPRRTVTVTVNVSEAGAITIDARGPVDGTAGLVALLDAARALAEQGQADG
jgi:hypothetical protein